jgi:sugar phosphate isomerase/epimerase
MTHRLSRREVLSISAQSAAAIGASSLLTGCSQQDKEPGGRERSARQTGHRFRLGLDTYMVHRSLTAEDDKNRRSIWSVIEQLDELGFEGVQIDPSHFKLLPGDDEAALRKLASIAEPKGYYVEFGMGGWDVQRMKERIALTARFGGKALRTFCGHEGTTAEELANYMQWAPPAFREAAAFADEHGVSIAIENHGDFTSVQLKELLDRADHPRVGACLDTGNSLFRKEDPIECAERLAPYATCMHLKDWFMTHGPDGKPHWTEAVLGEGEVPVARILGIVAKHHPDLYIALESPVQPSEDEAETVDREWRHLRASAAAARRLLAEL